MHILKAVSRPEDSSPCQGKAHHFSGITWPQTLCELANGRVLVVLFSTQSLCPFLSPALSQATPIAAAQPAHPWGALSPSPLTPLNKTARPSPPPASPGRNLEEFPGLHPHHRPMDRKVLVSGQLVLNPVLEKMQPKQMQNQIARVWPPSPAQGTFPHA